MASNGRRNHWTSWQLRLVCCLCQTFAGGMVTGIPAYCLFLSYVSPESSPLTVRCTLLLAIYFFLNLSVNWIQFRRKLVFNDVSAKTAVGRTDCVRCPASVPTGSHHCPVCELCVWRRDHHCFFLGGCVGFANLTNFVSFCFNACLGCAYALVAMRRYLGVDFYPLWSRNFAYYVIPYSFAQWSIGNVASRHLVAVVLSNAAVAALLSTLFAVVLQTYLIYTRKTSYEFFRRKSTLTPPTARSWRNFERALGNDWFLRLFVPALTLNWHASLAQPKRDGLNEAMKYV